MPAQRNSAEILSRRLSQLYEEARKEDEPYHALVRAEYKAYKKSGVPISKGNAEKLVWQHPFLLSYSGEKTGEAVKEYFRENTFRNIQMVIRIPALRSVEECEAIKVLAKTSQLHFDALWEAAMIALDPDYEELYFPTKESLYDWLIKTGPGCHTRPSRPTGPHPYENVVRDAFISSAVEALLKCGLPARTKEEDEQSDRRRIAPTRVSACGVVREVCGMTQETVWRVYYRDLGRIRE